MQMQMLLVSALENANMKYPQNAIQSALLIVNAYYLLQVQINVHFGLVCLLVWHLVRGR